MIYQKVYRRIQSNLKGYLPFKATTEGLISADDIQMQYRTLGRTNLRVSRVALGCGGPSKLGANQGKSPQESQQIIRHAFNLGVNFIDTANDYPSSNIIGETINDFGRDRIILSSKIRLRNLLKQRLTTNGLKQTLERSLKNLSTDYLDICHLASVAPEDYPYVKSELVPCLLDLKREGKIRFLGITEKFVDDTQHEMLQLALKDNCWDVMMVGFNLLNQSSRDLVFPHTQSQNIGVMAMYAVRKALRSSNNLEQSLTYLKQTGQIEPSLTLADIQQKLLVRASPIKATSLTDAAYRFCTHEPGVDVVLSGTGNLKHLEENIISILKPPLPEKDSLSIQKWFAGVTSFSGN